MKPKSNALSPRVNRGVAEILLVGDDPTDAEMSLQALRDAGFSDAVEHVEDSEEALDLIFEPKATPFLPKLILLNLNLRNMTAVHALRRLKTDERTKAVPVVVLSASKSAIEVIQSSQLGVNSYVIRPADEERFSEVVETVVNYWLKINEPPSFKPVSCRCS